MTITSGMPHPDYGRALLYSAVILTLGQDSLFYDILAVPYRIATAILLGGTVLLFIGSVPVAVEMWKRESQV